MNLLTLGFIILRHVNSPDTNNYWIESYRSIREIYPKSKIVIIDDSSEKEFLSDPVLINVEIVESEFRGRGELLPYYYYSRNRWFDNAIIIHDSVFIKSKLDFTFESDFDFKCLFHFEHHWDQPTDEIKIIKSLLDNSDLIKLYQNKKLWKGCFGGMSIVKHSYLREIDRKHDFSGMLDLVTTRYNRMSFERVIACLLQSNSDKKSTSSLLGNIHSYTKWGYSYSQYIKDGKESKLPIVKVWTGR